MTLPLPQIDSRTWSELVDEALARIPLHAPQWTDFNAHDPGVTLVELLAYKTEQILYSANRVTARLLHRILSLLDPSAGPTIPTSFVVISDASFTASTSGERNDDKFVASTTIDRNTIFLLEPDRLDESGAESPIMMRLVDEITIYDVRISTIRNVLNKHKPKEVMQSLRFGAGLAFPLIRPKKDSVPLISILLSSTLKEANDLSLFFEIENNGLSQTGSQSDQRWYCPELEWAAGNGTGRYSTDPQSGVVILEDSTEGLTRTGTVKLSVNNVEELIIAIQKGSQWPASRRIRRVLLNAALVEHVTPEYDPQARANGVSIDLPANSLTNSDGFAELALPQEAAHVRVNLETTTDSVEWKKLPFEKVVNGHSVNCQSLMDCESDEKVFEVDDNVLRFGNGWNGSSLPDSGNLKIQYDLIQPVDTVYPGARWNSLLPSAISAETVFCQFAEEYSVTNALRQQAQRANASQTLVKLATSNQGTLDGLDLRTILQVPSPCNAVCPTDFERLALDVPNSSIVRAKAFPEIDVTHPGIVASGTLSLVVVSQTFTSHSPRSQASSENVIQEVTANMNKFRAMGTRLVVIEPHLAQLRVELRVNVDQETYNFVKPRLRQSLTQFIDPITGGQSGRGCPFGNLLMPQHIYDNVILQFLKPEQIVTYRLDHVGDWFPWSLPVSNESLLDFRIATGD